MLGLVKSNLRELLCHVCDYLLINFSYLSRELPKIPCLWALYTWTLQRYCAEPVLSGESTGPTAVCVRYPPRGRTWAPSTTLSYRLTIMQISTWYVRVLLHARVRALCTVFPGSEYVLDFSAAGVSLPAWMQHSFWKLDLSDIAYNLYRCS